MLFLGSFDMESYMIIFIVVFSYMWLIDPIVIECVLDWFWILFQCMFDYLSIVCANLIWWNVLNNIGGMICHILIVMCGDMYMLHVMIDVVGLWCCAIDGKCTWVEWWWYAWIIEVLWIILICICCLDELYMHTFGLILVWISSGETLGSQLARSMMDK